MSGKFSAASSTRQRWRIPGGGSPGRLCPALTESAGQLPGHRHCRGWGGQCIPATTSAHPLVHQLPDQKQTPSGGGSWRVGRPWNPSRNHTSGWTRRLRFDRDQQSAFPVNTDLHQPGDTDRFYVYVDIVTATDGPGYGSRYPGQPGCTVVSACSLRAGHQREFPRVLQPVVPGPKEDRRSAACNQSLLSQPPNGSSTLQDGDARVCPFSHQKSGVDNIDIHPRCLPSCSDAPGRPQVSTLLGQQASVPVCWSPL